MVALVLLDHENGSIKQPARSAVAAASKIGGDVHVLVVGHNIAPAAEAAAKLPGVSVVLKADADGFAHELAEPLAALLVALAPQYSHLLSASTATGKNVMPRVAALLDVQPISDIADVIDADTFVRPIYAGNAMATVKSSDSKKVMTVRAASFDPVAPEGGSASIQDAPASAASTNSKFVSAGTDRGPGGDFRRPRHAEWREFPSARSDRGHAGRGRRRQPRRRRCRLRAE
jgi:electron transfer flavoprotein alpha subunit